MIEICAIASGSNGNCYYVGNSDEAVLIDAGISRKQTVMRMQQMKLNPQKVQAIFISHEHSDHFRGVRVLSQKMGVPVYITSKTLERSWHPHRPATVKLFTPGDTISVGRLSVHTFAKSHDAAEPCSFRVEHGGVSTGVFTDIGTACSNVRKHLSLCRALFLETNYDDNMLWAGNYPYHLKMRVASEHGHLSNTQAFELLQQYRHPQLQIVFLSHLSAENNRPNIALSTFEELKNQFAIKVTNRHAAAEVFTIKLNQN